MTFGNFYHKQGRHEDAEVPCTSVRWTILRRHVDPRSTPSTMMLEGPVRRSLINAAESLFSDNPLVWPLHLTMFYLGQIPDLTTLITD